MTMAADMNRESRPAPVSRRLACRRAVAGGFGDDPGGAASIAPPGHRRGDPGHAGHASSETTQPYAPLDDKGADAEVRAARRRRDRAAR
jgi:hypothetical protein